MITKVSALEALERGGFIKTATTLCASAVLASYATGASGGTDVGGTRGGSGILVLDKGSRNGSENIIIDAVHAYDNSHAGIIVNGAKHVILLGCICSGHDYVGEDNLGQRYGVAITASAEDVSLTGLLAFGIQVEAIRNDSRSTREV